VVAVVVRDADREPADWAITGRWRDVLTGVDIEPAGHAVRPSLGDNGMMLLERTAT
jgi:hypothetical protein